MLTVREGSARRFVEMGTMSTYSSPRVWDPTREVRER
jgi:hypothetical protein